jgi:hypothetical protein
MGPETRQYRGYRIVLQVGKTWGGIGYAPPNGSIVAADIEGARVQEALVKAIQIVDSKLSNAAGNAAKTPPTEGYLRPLQRLNDAYAADAAFRHSILVLYWDGSKRPEPIGC